MNPDNNARRYTRKGVPVGVSARADGKPVITGYAAVFYDANDPGTEYRIWEDVCERIMPGAFDDAIRGDDVRALFNHNDNLILGRTSAGTLRLSVDAKGLRYEIDPPDTQTARDLMESLKRGDVTGSSFMFRPVENVIRDSEGLYVIERTKVKLFDVGPVAFPAYESATAGVRSAADTDAVRREVEAWRAERARKVTVHSARARAAVVGLALAE
jgi:HK97 family phage prohead protease